MTRTWFFLLCGLMPAMAGQMPEKAAGYHEALRKRPESEALFTRFRDAWLEEKPAGDLEVELLSRAEAGELGAWGILGRAQLAAGKEDEALASFGKAIEAEPAAAWLRLARAKMLLAKKDFAAAEKDALAVPEGDKLRPEALKLAGLACLRGERVAEALAHWKKAVEAAPGDKSLLEDLTELTRREGRYDLALDFCAKWRDATDDAYGKAMATLKRSELLFASQRFEEAMAELGEVLKVSGDGSWLEREALGRAEQAFQRQGDATGWVKQIATWADVNPVRLNFRRAQAQALAAAGQPAQALEVLDQVLKRVPGDREARWQRISLLERDLKVQQAFDECAVLAAEEKSEETGLRLAELAFRLDKKDEVKKALDAVIAAADPVKQVGLAGLYARYGLPAESEKQWRAAAGGESGGQALRELAKFLRTEAREKDALEVWKEIGKRDHSQDRIDAAAALAGVGEREAARLLLEEGREKFSKEAGYEVARADLAMMQDRQPEAQAIFRELATRAQRPDELQTAVKGWLRAVAGRGEEAVKELGESTGDRCLRAAFLAESDKPLPALAAGDELERSMRLALLREYRKWPEVVALLEASGGSGPLFLSELCDAKFSAGDLPGALAAAKAWRERTPDQPGPWLKEADLMGDGGGSAEAEVLLRRAVARFESDENVARALFSVLEKNRGVEAALNLAWQRHDQGADAAAKAGWLREIIRVSKNGQGMEDLKERFEERARRDPASPGPLVALADMARTNGDTQEELSLMTKAVACAPRDVAIVSRLAALEEQMGWRDRALQRYEELARLVPGTDSARQLAQAKLRCGDVKGGMRDLQALAGDKGIDVRELENSATSLAVRGYVEESIELLGALDPARVDARLHFVLGTLLEADGREVEALDHFLKVWNEPDDPAELESRGQGWGGTGVVALATLVDMQRYQQGQEYGILQQVPVPGSLAQAKSQLPARLVRIGMRSGGELWEKVGVAIPDLKAGTIGQWQEVKGFASEGAGGYSANWWAFVVRYPDNPLGLEMLFGTQQYTRGTAEQKEALLRREPPVPPKLALSLRVTQEATEETVAWLEKLEQATWQDERSFQLVASLPEQALMSLEREEKPDPALAARVDRLLAMLEKGNPTGERLGKIKFLRARQALAAGKVDAFLAGLQQALEVPYQSDFQRVRGAWVTSVSPMVADSLMVPLANWRKRKGDAAAAELIERLPSPVLRCLGLLDGGLRNRDACQQRALKELAALAPDAPREVRRDLIRLSWLFAGRTPKVVEEARKQLRAAATDDSDPRLALEAFVALSMQWGESDGGEFSPPDLQRMESLAKRLSVSDESDRRYAEWIGQMFHRQNPRTPTVTKWGSVSGSGYGYGYGGGIGGNGMIINRIVALKDQRPAAVQEAANLLESTARGSMGRVEQLSRLVKDFKKAGLLDDALAKIALPEDAGLSRKVAMRVLMDAAERPDAAREIIAGIQRQRPWESYWLLELALRSEDREESFRLLDDAAARQEFSKLLVTRNFDRNFDDGSPDGSGMARMKMLADWAERPQSKRDWLGPATLSLGNRIGTSGQQQQQDVLELYQRYCKLALADPRSAEVAFGSLYLTTLAKDPAAVEEAARQVLLSGAYVVAGSDEGLPQGFNSGTRGQAPAAISHLVAVAAEKGDEATFPADFREKLKAVDPAFDTWLGTLLGTKRAMDLPDVFRELNAVQLGAGWVKHEASLLRASQLPGRDELLVKIFKEQKQQAVSGNVIQVIRASLAAATKEKVLEKRLLLFLEASAGPRKDWKWPENYQLSNVCGQILQAAGQSDSATVVGVVKCFATWKVMGYQQMDVSQNLGQLWRKELGDPKANKWDGMPGTSPREALYIGFWQVDPDENGNATRTRFRWTFPQALQAARGSEKDLAAQVAGNPKAPFIDVMRAAAISNNRSLYKRALKHIEPELAKLPAEMREGVIDALTARLGKEDVEGLSKLAVARLGKRLEEEKAGRIRSVRETLKLIKASPGSAGNPDHMCGELIGKISSDDPQLAAEILEYWQSLKSPRDNDAFAMAIMSNASGVEQIFERLSYLDKLWKGEPPPGKATRGGGDFFNAVWNRIDGKTFFYPVVWDRIASLSPRMQVRLLLAGSQGFRMGRDQQEPPDLSPATKKIELLRQAHAWYEARGRFNRDSSARADGTLLLSYARALKKSGADDGQLAGFLGEEMRYLPQLENAETILKETPELLAGIQSLPVETAQELFNGVSMLWSGKRQEWRKMSPVPSETQASPPVYPEATASFLKFVLLKGAAAGRNGFGEAYGMTNIVLDIGDAELLEQWIARGGSSLAGDMRLVLQLLRSGNVKQAIALAPGTGSGRSFSGSLPFTKEIEQLVKKLEEVDSSQAFLLRASMSLWFDARGEEAPDEPLEARRERLAGELDKRAKDLPAKDRMQMCVYLGLPKKGALGPVPALDEFAGEAYAREFSDRLGVLMRGNTNDPVGPLHVGAVCSRFHAGDAAGMEKLVDLFAGTLGEGPVAWEMSENWLPMIQTCFWRYADQHDAVLPEASSKAILKMADMLAQSERQDWRSVAALMIRLASKTPEATTAALEAAKLQEADLKSRFYLNDRIDREVLVRSVLRVAVLHPANSQELLKSFLEQGLAAASKSGMLDLLGDPKVQARLQPADFITWVKRVHRVTPEAIAAATAYVEEKGAGFNDEQRQSWEGIRTRLQNAPPAPPDFREGPRFRDPRNPDRR